MDGRLRGTIAGHQVRPSASQSFTSMHTGCFSVNTLCIGNCFLICDMMDVTAVIHVLPQADGGLHVDEARVFAELPVHVIGDPSLPVMGINRFPGKNMGYK